MDLIPTPSLSGQVSFYSIFLVPFKRVANPDMDLVKITISLHAKTRITIYTDIRCDLRPSSNKINTIII